MEAASIQVRSQNDVSDLPLLPRYIWTKDRQMIDTGTTIWKLRASSDDRTIYSINWQLLDTVLGHPNFSERAQYLMKLYLADRFQKKKVSTVRADYTVFLHFGRWLATLADAMLMSPDLHIFDWSQYSEGIARAYLDHCIRCSAEKGNYFSSLRVFYEWGTARQYPDFDINILHILKLIRTIGNAKGHHVRFRHPTKGPFSSDELLLIRNAISAKKGEDRDRAVVMLHLELGINPSTTVRLKNKDIKRYDTKSGSLYQIDVPRIKKRNVYRETKRRPISPQLGNLLQSLQQGEPEDPLFYWFYKSTPKIAVTEAMLGFVKAAEIKLPQTGELLVIHPRRFRTTLATHMIEEGASDFQVAEALDHSDLQNVKVYVQTSPAITDKIANATDSVLGPLVNRFLGKLIESADTIAFEGLPNQMIPAATPHLPLPMLSVSGVGMCGRDVRKDGLCRLFPPFSCYLCSNFGALRTGPHQQMLNSIEHFMHEAKNTIDNRILKQLEDICTAIKEVLQQCKLTQPKEL